MILPWFIKEYINKKRRKLSAATLLRKLSALKSLFNYLQNQEETKELKPYIERNIIAKIEFNSIKGDQETIANRIGGKILCGDEFEQFEQFRQFVSYDYYRLLHKTRILYICPYRTL